MTQSSKKVKKEKEKVKYIFSALVCVANLDDISAIDRRKCHEQDLPPPPFSSTLSLSLSVARFALRVGRQMGETPPAF